MLFLRYRTLEQATWDVQTELESHGFWDARVESVGVYLVGVASCYGWQHYGESGDICIPRISLTRWGEYWARIRGTRLYYQEPTLKDVIRHEYAHAVADTHRGLMRSRRFREAFESGHHWDHEWEYHPHHFVSAYAASAPGEDFAETFMMFLRYGGQLPPRFNTPCLRKKWRFIRDLGRIIVRGGRRW